MKGTKPKLGGVTTLLAALAIVLFPLPAIAQPHGILREVYDQVADGSLASLTNASIFPDQPTRTNIVTNYFVALTNNETNYGQRMRGYVYPPATGDYLFWIASAAQGLLSLSTDETPLHRAAIARVNGWTNPQQWTKEANQQSKAIHLELGRRYYIEALQSQGSSGTANLAVAWRLPGATGQVLIDTQYLAPIGPATNAPSIAIQPQSPTVAEGAAITLFVQSENLDPLSYQWQRNSVDIPGATNSNFVIPVATSPEYEATYRCQLSNALGSVESSNAVVTIVVDRTPPTILSVINSGPTNVIVQFSEPVTSASAASSVNYSLNNGVRILRASLSADQQRVVLATTMFTYGKAYLLTVKGIRDLAYHPNTIATGTQVAFTAYEYLPTDIGSPRQPGAVTVVTNGIHVTAGGTDIAGNSDQFQFNYQVRDGNFDLAVRVQGMTASDTYAKAGLMARETLEARSRFAAALATPNLGGTFFASRATVGGAAANTGYYPVNYPDTWLRLKRLGSAFSGYASSDGLTWVQLGTATMSLSNSLYVGMAACSRSTNQATQVDFRELGNTLHPAVVTLAALPDKVGPANRRSGLVLSEIMYHPVTPPDGRKTEFVELFNTNPFFEEIGGYSLAGDIHYTFPAGTVLKGGEYVVVAPVPADVEALYGIGGVYGPASGKLSNNSGTVQLRNNLGAVLFEVKYDSHSPWPVSPDGTGHSLVLDNPSYGEADPRAWAASAFVGGSPGKVEPLQSDSLRQVVINEWLAHPNAAQFGYVELYNHGQQPVSLAGCVLTDSLDAEGFILPPGMVLPANAYVAFTEGELGFRLKSAGATLYLWNPGHRFVIDAVRFGPEEEGISAGRFPNGGNSFYRLSLPSPGAPNPQILVSPVGINELMYHPISNDDNDQYVELYNHGAQPVDLSQWRISGGIGYTFPNPTLLPADGYLVVAKDAARLLANYPSLSSSITYGNLQGKLSSRGERVVLEKPVAIVEISSTGLASTNWHYAEVDEVTYGSGGRWGQWANGGGSSLELIDPHSNKRLPSNWADSDETAKAPWTTVEFTGKLDNGNASYPPTALHLLLMDAGECLVDEVEAFMSGKTNGVSNSGFEVGQTNWFMQGNHDLSFIENSVGYGGGRALHIRSTGPGDTGANRIRTKLSVAMVNNGTGTLRAKARWLRGCPDILLRLLGNYLDCAGRLNVPANLGTPGAPNSRLVTNAPPAITQVAHWPPAPAASQSVLVTAQVQDPDGIGSVVLHYRVDPAKTYYTVPMLDDGTGDDALAGDGVYSARISGRPSGTTVAFYIEASDQATPVASATFPSDAPQRECLVRFGDAAPAGGLGVYRLWISQATLDRWVKRERLSNEPLDCTFVYGNTRVIYNMGGYYSGSPWHAPGYTSPVTGTCDYGLTFPPDDPFLGETSIALLQPGNGGGDTTGQQEQAAYWMAWQLGVPISYRRYVNLYVNGTRRGIVFEDVQRPNANYEAEWYPGGPNGDLHKVVFWYEFNDAASAFNNPVGASLAVFTSGGVKKLARYRWNFPRHAVHGSANDYTNLLSLVDSLNTTATSNAFTTKIQSALDVEEWAKVLLVEKLVGNTDSYGNGGGQNMFLCKPEADVWRMIIWDIDFAFNATGPTGDIQNFSDAPLSKLFRHPPFLRTYWQVVQEAWRGPLQNARIDPLLDAKYSALKGNGLSVSSPSGIKSYITQRRNSVQSLLNRYNVPFKITSNNGVSFTTNTSQLVLTGVAPLDVRYVALNGTNFVPYWTTATNWTLQLPLQRGLNIFVAQGLDKAGRPLTNAPVSIRVTSTSSTSTAMEDVVINEWMAANASTSADPADQSYADWIELYNPGNRAINLSGWRLANNLTNLGFILPSGTAIGAKDFLVIWADGQPEQAGKNQSGLHANFKLSRDGEEIALWTAVGRLADYVHFGAQTNDISQGRYPDGVRGTDDYYMPIPTPGQPNVPPPGVGPPVPLRFHRISWDAAGLVTLRWLRAPGTTDHVQFKDRLEDSGWKDLATAPLSDGFFMSAMDFIQTSQQRYYRIVRGE